MNTAMMRYGRAAALVLVGAPIMGMPGSSQAQNAGPSQAQKALKIVMVPKFTGTAYFAATEKGAKEAVAELKGKGVAIDFLYTGPSVPNTDEEIRMIDDLPLIVATPGIATGGQSPPIDLDRLDDVGVIHRL